jgi:hypothetical protein
MLRKFWIAMAVFWVLLIGWKLVALTGLLDRPPAIVSSEFECDPLKTAQLIEKGKRVPQPVLYYWGKRTPDLAEWSQHDFRPFWRGLFAGEWTEDTEKKLIPAGQNWLSSLQLNEKCLNSETVESLIDLPARDRFTHWYEFQKFPQALSLWSAECFLQDGKPNPEQFHFSPSHAVDPEETSCERVVNQYLNDKKIFILQNSEQARTWIIRNPDCVAKIQNEESYWAHEFWQNSDLWKNTCRPSRSHADLARIWFQSLHDQGSVIPPANASFAKLLQNIPPPRAIKNEAMDDASCPGFCTELR